MDDKEDYKATIKVGQNAKENDELFSTADQDDIWFHLDKGASSHVYLSFIPGKMGKSMEKKVLKGLLHECALLVKQHSKCNMKAKVNYIEKRHLSKEKWCKAGEVILKKSPESI